MKQTKKSLLMSLVAMLLCFSMLLGTTWAWFTDSVASAGNRIVSGSLKVDLLHYSQNGWVSLKENPDHKLLDYDLWEPGYTRVERLKVKNLGNLALKYQISAQTAAGTPINGANGERLSDVIDVYICRGDSNPASFNAITADSRWVKAGNLTAMLYGSVLADGSLLPATSSEETISLAFHMQESAGNEYQNLSVGDIHLTLVATQYTHESDSFGNQYDNDSIFPSNKMNYSYSAPVSVTADNKAAADVEIGDSDKVLALVGEGTKLDPGVSELTLNVTDLVTPSTIVVESDEEARTVDVHVSGLAADNNVPVIVYVRAFMPTGLNMGNYTLYHIENNVNVPMTYVSDEAQLDAHNEFTYDPATGDVRMALKSFSLIVTVAETDFSWKGGVDHTWYMSHKDESTFYISNADQLWSLSQIVGGMAIWGDTYAKENSFVGKTIKLTTDINLGQAEGNRNTDENGNPYIFYPIGYYNSEKTYEKNPSATEYISSYFKPFEGVFDGQGHTISNIYQNTWEMKGDNEFYDASLQYFRDGMGLFGKVWGGTVKNLTVSNFTSDGEYTTTGVIAAYADSADGRSASFENIAITNCNPRVYNIGNGGIVGCAGWYSRDTSKYNVEGVPVTFTNITVDNTNKISALWGSWGVACAGILGTYYPNSKCGVTLTNCHIAAQIDANNDVCGNYQYYWYRYAGMVIGTIRASTTDENGYTIPDMTGITAEGCTVHFGDWNNYYYCELVVNTLASYTHDHQMSRLDRVAAVDGTTITDLDGRTYTVPSSGRYNYVVIKDKNAPHSSENAECYHFVDGAVWNHEDAGTEVVDGVTVLKEDKQHIYLPFNQLFQGDGYGIKHIPVYNGNDYAFEGITVLDVDAASSVDKFTTTTAGVKKTLNTDKCTDTITIGSLFTPKDDAALGPLKLKADNVYITVEMTSGKRIVEGTDYEWVNTEGKWNEKSLRFLACGQYKITVQDYYYCNPTSIVVDVQPVILSDDVYYTAYHGNWSAGTGEPTAVDRGYDFLLNTVGWNYENTTEAITTPKIDADGNPVYDENGDQVYVSVDKEYWISTYMKTGGTFVGVGDIFVTSTVQIRPNELPVMFTTTGSGEKHGAFVLHNLGKKDEVFWLTSDVIFDNIDIVADPVEYKFDPRTGDYSTDPNPYTNAMKVTGLDQGGKVVIRSNVNIDSRIGMIVEKGGYLWLDTHGFASYTGNGIIVVGPSLMTYLQSASGKAELARFFEFVRGGGMLVDEYGRMLKIYKYSYTGSGNVDYVISRVNDTLTLDDAAIRNINAENYAGVPDLHRYVQYVNQGGKIVDKNGTELKLHQFTSTGKYLITNTAGQIPVLEGGSLVYKASLYYDPDGTGNGSSAGNAVSDLAEAIEFVTYVGTIGLTDETIIALNSMMLDYENSTTEEAKATLTTLYSFVVRGGELVDERGNEILLNRVYYAGSKYQYLITDTDMAVARMADGKLKYDKTLYVSYGTRGSGYSAEHGVYYTKTLLNEGGSNYLFKDATDKISGYTLVLDDAAINYIAGADTDAKNVFDFVSYGGRIVDSEGKAINICTVTKYDAETGAVPTTSYLLVHSTDGIATNAAGKAPAYTKNLFYAHDGNGKGTSAAAPLRSLDEAAAALGTLAGRSITVKSASVEYITGAEGQTALAELYDFGQAGGQVKLHAGADDTELVFQNVVIEKAGDNYLLKTTEGLFVYGSTDYRAEVHVGDAVTSYNVATLKDAYDQLGAVGGTILLENAQTLTANFTEPAHTGVITVKGAGIGTGGVNRQYHLGGPTTFENITFTSSADKGLMIVANYYPVVIGENVTCSGFTTSSTVTATANNFTVVGGFYGSAASEGRTIEGSDITVRSGSRVYIVGQDLGLDTTHSYNANITVTGGEIYRIYVSGTKGTSSGNLNLNISGGTFTDFIAVGSWTPNGTAHVMTVTGGDFTNSGNITGVEGSSTLRVTAAMQDAVVAHIKTAGMFTVETIG